MVTDGGDRASQVVTPARPVVRIIAKACDVVFSRTGVAIKPGRAGTYPSGAGTELTTALKVREVAASSDPVTLHPIRSR
jgi:hypothetical protein